MKRVEKVWAELAQYRNSQAKLSNHKIDLSAFDDLDKRLKEFKDQNSLISDLIEEVAKKKREFSDDFQNLSNEYKSLSDDYEDLFSKASDLGADDLADKAFDAKLELTNVYGFGASGRWDKEVLGFLQK